MSKSTALTTVSALVAEGAQLVEQGDSYYARAGAKFLEAREAAGGYTTLYRATLRKCGVAERTERHVIRMATVPDALEAYRENDRAQQKRNRPARQESCRAAPNQVKNLAPIPGWTPPPPMSEGELHEAVAHWKAYHARADKAFKAWKADQTKTKTNEDNWWMYRNSKFAAFESLVAQSNLPALTGMTPAQIIALIR